MASTSLLIQWLQEHCFSLLFLLLLSLVFRRFLHEDKLKPNLPPSPPKLPIIGNLHQLGSLPHRALHALSQKYGPIMQMHLGSSPTIIVSSAEIAKEITKNYDVVFSNRPVSTASKAFVFGGRDVAFSPHGEYWRQMRKICVLDLLSVRRVQSYKLVREEEIRRMLEKIGNMANNPVNLSKEVIMVMNNIISRITLGRKLEGNVEVLMWIKELMNLFGNFSVEDLFPSLRWLDVLTGLDRRMKNTSKAFHGFLDEVVEDHISRNRNRDGGDNDEHKDFVDILLECQKDVSLGIPPFSRGELRAILMDMFVGGTDATYATIEWAMTELMKHPELMKKVKEDVRKFVRNKSIVEENDIHQMEYLNCVIKETLRLHPPLVLGLQRLSSAPTTIGGYSIPANTRLIINLWAITRDPKHWDRPDEFIPDRFISSPLDYKGADYEFIPFGVGRRGCPGTAFGMASVETVLANLLCWFDWELPADADKGRLGVESFGLGVHLKYPLTLIPQAPTS